MVFRGCNGLTADQIAAIYAQLGSDGNADTQQNVTQYFVTVPAKDLDVALRVDAACMADVADSQHEWEQERGAIQQEVARDLSSPVYKFITRLNKDLFAGTPYETDALGTKSSFDQTTGESLKNFYRDWYAPNNAILVIAGDVDPVSTLAKIRQYYGAIPRRPLPARHAVNLKPVPADSFTLDSNLPYVLTFVAFRFPGTDSPDFASARILSDVLSSQRADLYALVPQGKALDTAFALLETYPKASAAFALAYLPGEANAAALNSEMKKVVLDYATKGVPPDLVDAAKKGEIASAEFARNSISNLASLWSQALAAEGRQSPDEIVEAIKRVTVDDVNRVAKTYLLQQNPIIATLKPSPSGEPVSGKGFGGTEVTTTAPTKPVQLPDWAEAAVKSLSIPQPNLHPADLTLPNGIRLIVQTEKTSPTITLIGSVKQQTQLQTPPGKDGVSDVLEGLFSYGTKTLDRLAFQKALDDIAASESAGASFNLKVLKQYFARGVELLADNELHPALPPDAFKVVQEQTAQYTAGALQSPGYRMNRALELALLPKGDPLLRETTPQTISSLTYDDVDRVLQKYIPARSDYHRCDRRHHSRRGARGNRKVLQRMESVRPQTLRSAAAGSGQQAECSKRPDPAQVQDTVDLSQQLELNRFHRDYYALQLGNHVLGGGFYATRLYRDLRQKAGYVYNIDNSLHASETRATYTDRLRLRSTECFKGESARPAGTSRHAEVRGHSRRVAAGQGAATAADPTSRSQRGFDCRRSDRLCPHWAAPRRALASRATLLQNDRR